MSTATKIETNFWEKLGDGLTAFSEGVGKFFLNLFGSSNERIVRSLGYVRAQKAGAVSELAFPTRGANRTEKYSSSSL